MEGKEGKASRLQALDEHSFKQEDINYLKLEFVKDATQKVTEVVFTFDDGYTIHEKKVIE